MNDTVEIVPFREVLSSAIGGGWGEDEPSADHVEVRVVRGTDFGRIQALEFFEIPRRFEAQSKVPQRTLQPGDILLEISGGSRTANQTTGRTLLITDRILKHIGGIVIPASFCRLVRVDRSKIDPVYAYYALQDMYKAGRAGLYEHQSTGISNFQFEYFLDSEFVRLPGLTDQEKIAGALRALDDKIENNRWSARALERLARALFRAWFVDYEPVKAKAAGATSFPGMPQPVFESLPTHFVDSDLGRVPEGWEVSAIGDVVTAKGGGTPSTKTSEYWNGEHCWVTPKDMSRLSHPVLLDTERRITDAGVECISSGILPVGTVLMSSRAPVGYLAIAGVPTAVNQGFIAMVCDGPLPPTYILQWALSSIDAIKAQASGTTFPEISKKSFRPLPVVVPSSDIVAAYHETVQTAFDLLASFVVESKQLAAVRDYLLPRLLIGSVGVK